LDERWFTTGSLRCGARIRFRPSIRTTSFFTYSPPGTNASLVSSGYMRTVGEAVAAHKRTGIFNTYHYVVDSY
jgi:hypothetical protein